MNENNNERYGGKPFQVGGKTYLLAPLSIGAIKRYRQAIAKVTGGDTDLEEAFELGLSVIRSSLQRNYPELTAEVIEDEIVDGSNNLAMFWAVLEASGFKPKGKSGAESPTM
jgi:hypothetical protein